MSLTEFLLARIAEDEGIAKACLGVNQLVPRRWVSDGRSVRDSAERTQDQIVRVAHTWAREAEHIARWDPARVLAECEAKRRIVEIHRNNEEPEATGSCGRCTDMDYLGLVTDEWPCDTLKALALPYADHPDYLPEWRPDPVNAE